MVKRLASSLFAAALITFLPAVASASASQVNLIVGLEPGVGSAERVEIRRDADVRFDQRLLLPRAELVSVRGQVMVRAGEWVGTTGTGVFLRREPKPT